MSPSSLPPRRTALVTGASSGIGRATSLALARGGYDVLLVARRREALDAVASEIGRAGGVAHVWPCDVTDISQVRALGAGVRERHGVLDVLVNNAGAGRFLSLVETSHEEARDMIAAPYLAAFYCTREFLPGMLDRGYGRVVNVASPAGWFPIPGAVAYSVGRWAMRGLHDALTADLRGTGVLPVLVVPAKVRTPYFEHNPGSEERIPWIASVLMGTLDADVVARRLVAALTGRRRVVLMPATLPVLLLVQRLFPRFAFWLSTSTGWRAPPTRGAEP